jgi:hypothetical protein
LTGLPAPVPCFATRLRAHGRSRDDGGAALPDDMRRWPDAPEEAAYAQRQAAERLTRTPDTDAGWLVCLASQVPAARCRTVTLVSPSTARVCAGLPHARSSSATAAGTRSRKRSSECPDRSGCVGACHEVDTGDLLAALPPKAADRSWLGSH